MIQIDSKEKSIKDLLKLIRLPLTSILSSYSRRGVYLWPVSLLQTEIDLNQVSKDFYLSVLHFIP